MIRQGTFKERYIAAKNPETSPIILAEAIQDDDVMVRFAAAINTSTPEISLGAALIQDSSSLVRCAAAENTSTVPVALAAALRSPDPRIVWYVAQNPSTPKEALTEYHNTLIEIMRSPDSKVRRDAAKNQFMPPDALVAALRDTNLLVRWRAAQNPSMPVEALAATSFIVRWPSMLLKFVSFDEWRRRIGMRIRARRFR